MSEAAPEPEDGGQERDGAQPRRILVKRRRRAPRYRSFGVTGALVGVAAGVVLGLFREPRGDYTQQAIVGYFATALGLIGALAGLAVALLAERLTARR